MKTVTLLVRTTELAHFGPNLHEVIAGVELLERAGWVCVRKEQNFTYMRAPDGHRGRHALVKVQIPDDDEIMTLAKDLHAQGNKWDGQAYGWDAHYTPGHIEHRLIAYPYHDTPDYKKIYHSSKFSIGIPMVWHIELIWDADGEPKYHDRFGEYTTTEP